MVTRRWRNVPPDGRVAARVQHTCEEALAVPEPHCRASQYGRASSWRFFQRQYLSSRRHFFQRQHWCRWRLPSRHLRRPGARLPGTCVDHGTCICRAQPQGTQVLPRDDGVRCGVLVVRSLGGPVAGRLGDSVADRRGNLICGDRGRRLEDASLGVRRADLDELQGQLAGGRDAGVRPVGEGREERAGGLKERADRGFPEGPPLGDEGLRGRAA